MEGLKQDAATKEDDVPMLISEAKYEGGKDEHKVDPQGGNRFAFVNSWRDAIVAVAGDTPIPEGLTPSARPGDSETPAPISSLPSSMRTFAPRP